MDPCWAISTLAAEKLQIRCVMETHVITIKPPLQIVDMVMDVKPIQPAFTYWLGQN